MPAYNILSISFLFFSSFSAGKLLWNMACMLISVIAYACWPPVLDGRTAVMCARSESGRNGDFKLVSA